MTLQELSHQYRADADVFAARIRQLEQRKAQTQDEDERWQLHRRINELRPLLRQSRALAELTGHYYDRGYRKHAQYQL